MTALIKFFETLLGAPTALSGFCKMLDWFDFGNESSPPSKSQKNPPNPQ
jgi:hypothetical protein